ncbi:MAG: hypothetical protein EAX96_19895 [Candidatus Lokiarchaeota archaeon]|nr:hypothetical protein [Candidatus Lokiarchaeota archaeon]
MILKVNVKTYAILRKYAPQDVSLGDSFPLKIEGHTIKDVIRVLGIPNDENIVILVNGNRINNLDENLFEDDLVVFFPRLGGG